MLNLNHHYRRQDGPTPTVEAIRDLFLKEVLHLIEENLNKRKKISIRNNTPGIDQNLIDHTLQGHSPRAQTLRFTREIQPGRVTLVSIGISKTANLVMNARNNIMSSNKYVMSNHPI